MEFKRKDVWGLLLVLFLGQLVAFSMAVSSFASSLIANLVVKAYQYSYITSGQGHVWQGLPLCSFQMRKHHRSKEYCVKKKDRVEVVAMLGLFGLIINWLYYLAFTVVAIGLIIYSLK
nr:unnamed protein product [Digitaria exilis]